MIDKGERRATFRINYASICLLASIPRSLSRILSIFAAGDKWRRCVCMNIMKPCGLDGRRPREGRRETTIRIRARRNDDIIIMKRVISQSVNCTESKDGWACPGKSDAASNIPEGVVKTPVMATSRGGIGAGATGVASSTDIKGFA